MNHYLRCGSIAGWVILLIAAGARGQRPGSTAPAPPSSATIRGPISSTETESPRFLYGRVVTEDGKPVGEPVSVAYSCGTRSMLVVQSDLKGQFQIIIGTRLQGNTDMTASNDSPLSPVAGRTTVTPDLTSFGGADHRLMGCELRVSVPGFQPLTKMIDDPSSIGSIDTGNLVLRRLEGVQGAAVSATSLGAPGGARKEFERGENDVRNHQLDSAMQHLEKAVAEYDKYAAA